MIKTLKWENNQLEKEEKKLEMPQYDQAIEMGKQSIWKDKRLLEMLRYDQVKDDYHCVKERGDDQERQ